MHGTERKESQGGGGHEGPRDLAPHTHNHTLHTARPGLSGSHGAVESPHPLGNGPAWCCVKKKRTGTDRRTYEGKAGGRSAGQSPGTGLGPNRRGRDGAGRGKGRARPGNRHCTDGAVTPEAQSGQRWSPLGGRLEVRRRKSRVCRTAPPAHRDPASPCDPCAHPYGPPRGLPPDSPHG